jgi:two-component system response regulator BaeR
MIKKDVPLICIVEDEVDLASLLSDYLIAAGFQTVLWHRGDAANEWLENNEPALILLDLMLPGMDGLQLCRSQQHRAATPIIMMTAKVEEVDRLLGLELGADDYICKPYSPREVVARVKSVLRRAGTSQTTEMPENPPVVVDSPSMSVHILGKPVELTTIEFQLFSLLYSQPGRIFSRQYILDNIYHDYRIVSDRTVDGHVKKLRKKLGAVSGELELIRSVYGSGYKYQMP